MAQLAYMTGTVSEISEVKETEYGTKYIQIIIQDDSTHSKKFPITFFGNRADEVNEKLRKEVYVRIEFKINSFERSSQNRTWLNISLNGESFKILDVDGSNRNTSETVNTNDIRKKATQSISKTKSGMQKLQNRESMNKHLSNASVENTDSTHVKSNLTQQDQNDTVNETNLGKEFDDSLFDDLM